METTVPYHPGLLLGRSVDMKSMQIGYMLVGDEINPTTVEVNIKTAQFSLVNTLKDVCDVLMIPPEYGLKVKAGIVKNDMVSECFERLGNADTFTVIFKASFLQRKQYLSPDVVPMHTKSGDEEDESGPSTESLLADAVADDSNTNSDSRKTSEHGTHWVKALEIGNEMITILRISSKDTEKFAKLKWMICECLGAYRGLLDYKKLESLHKLATEIDKKLSKKHYNDVDLTIQYCTFHELEKYPTSFAGMVKSFENFMDQREGWIQGIKHGKRFDVEACCMTCVSGRDKEEKPSVTEAIWKKLSSFQVGPESQQVTYHPHAETPDSTVDEDHDSFVVLDDSGGPQHFYNLRVTLQSFEGENDAKDFSSLSCHALSQYPEETNALFDKLYKLLQNSQGAGELMRDFLSSKRFLLENRNNEANDVLHKIQNLHLVANETVQRLDYVTNPSESTLEDTLSVNPMDTVRLFIENVTSKLPPGSDLDLLMIGKTGHGKSSTGNSILGQKKFVSSADGDSVTSRTGVAWADIDGRTIKVVDTPGVCDTNLSSDEDSISLAISSISEAIANCPEGFHALLLIIRFGIRMTDEEKKAIGLLKCILGEDIVKSHCVCVITHGDNFETEMADKKTSFQDWCRTQKGFLKELFEECNYRCVLFNNKAADRKVKKAQLIHLISKVDGLKESGTRYTNSLFEFAQRERQRIISEQQVPQANEEMMRDIQLILEYLNTMVGNTAEHDQYREELARLRDRVDNLSNRVTEAESGQLGCLVDTVFSLAATIHTKMDEIADRPEPDQPDDDTKTTMTKPKEADSDEARNRAGSSTSTESSNNNEAFERHREELQTYYDKEISPQNSMVTKEVSEQVKKEVDKEKQCFPGTARVMLAGGKYIKMNELQLGNRVLVRDGKGYLGYDTVYMFGHKDFNVSSEFMVLKTALQSVSVTKGHYVYCIQNDKEVCIAAENIQVGDRLLVTTTNGLEPQPVMTITYERKQGLFAPFTLNGTIVVDQALMSCYIDVLSASKCHTLLWPIRQLYHLSPRTLAFVNGSTPSHPVPRWADTLLKFM